MRNFLITILVLCGFALIGSFFYYQYCNSSVDSKSKADVEVIISKGMSTNRIARELKEKHLIKSEFFFKVMVKMDKASLKASAYLLKKNMTTKKIIKELEKGSVYNPDAVNITFREGERITDYANTIAEKTNIKSEDFIAKVNDKEYIKTLIKKYWFLTDEVLNDKIYYPLEGYLAPNTYEFKNKDVKSEDIIEKMLSQTDAELGPYKKQLQEQDEYTIHQYFTFASMIELEVKDEENMKMIMDVYLNRMDAGMSLGCDATTYYSLQIPMDRDLKEEELNVFNDYNTRSLQMTGLPVGPICNPSIVAIRSAIEPEDNDYLFYVTDKNGKVYYSKTINEHNKNIKQIKDNGDWIW